jgi:hypothetical protein
VDWIRTAVGGVQPGGGHMFEALRRAATSQTGRERWPVNPMEGLPSSDLSAGATR